MAGEPIKLHADIRQAQKFLAEISPGGVRRSASRAMNKSAKPAFTAAARGVQKYRNLTQKRIKEAVTLSKATPDVLVVVIGEGGRLNASTRLQVGQGASITSDPNRAKGVPLHWFRGTRELKRGGVSVEVIKGRRKVIESAFIAGKKGRVWMRRWATENPSKGPYTGPGHPSAFPRRYRFPIFMLLGPSIESALRKKDVMDSVDDAFSSRFGKNFRHELEREINRASKKALRG